MNNVAQNLTGMQTIQQMLKTESETRGIVEKWKSGKVYREPESNRHAIAGARF
jgi:hypothetical protein